MHLDTNQARRLMNALLGDGAAAGSGEADGALPAQLSLGSFGRYRLLRLIGSGGMGEVYEAEQDHPRRKVALKVIRADVLSPEAATRFEHEAKILGRLQHPGIARIYEAGRVAAHGVMMPYFAMEFVDGRPLLDYIRQNHLGLRARLDLFVRICEAVEHAHRMGVIHRDLKPANILTDASGQPRVLDFGVARVTESDVQATMFKTDLGQLVGTLAYMSPEQISQDTEGLDTRSDVYSLGVVLYEMLSGRAPYHIDALHLPEAARVIVEKAPAPLSATDRALRGDIETIVNKALAKERERRYQSVADLAADIHRFLHDEPITARPASVAYQVRRFAARHTGAFTASAVAAVAVMAGSAATGWLAWKQAALIGELRRANSSEQALAALANSRRLESEQSAATAWEVVNFVNKTIAAANPYNNAPDYTVRAFVHQVAEELGHSRLQDPATEAALRDAVARLLGAIGEYEEAVVHSERSVSLRTRAFGSGHALTMQAMATHIRTLICLGRAAEGLEMATLAMNDLNRAAGADVSIAFILKHEVVHALLVLGRLDEAETTARSLLDEMAGTQGNHREVTEDVTDTLAAILYRNGRVPPAVDLWQALVDSKRAEYGDDSLHTVGARANLVMARLSLKQYPEVEKELRILVPLIERIAGRTAPLYATSLYNLAVALFRQGRAEEAEPVAREAAEQSAAVLGADNPDTAMANSLLSDILAATGRVDDATVIAQSSLEQFQAVVGPDHQFTLTAMLKVARLRDRTGHTDEAEQLLRHRRELALNRYGGDNFATMRTCRDLGEFLLEKNRPGEARAPLAEANAAAITMSDLDTREWMQTRIAYARCLLALGEYAVAEACLFPGGPEEPPELEDINPVQRSKFWRAAAEAALGLADPQRADTYRDRATRAENDIPSVKSK
ncbi:MAG: serine/threonine protein kinase [Phycisphaerales bacterium]|nr:serine/threonine protein kinase [Phycisphaerales bacterium]